MKIKHLAMAIAVCGMMMVSCGKTQKAEGDSTEVAVAETEEVDCDSSECEETECIENDSIVTRGGTASEGFGRCLQSGCNCKEFEGRGQTCRNCGHAYKKHY